MSDVLVKERPDLTRIKDPAEVWPEPMDCPDWPLQSGGARLGGRSTRGDAEARLASIAAMVNSSAAELREPTKADVARVLDAHFRKLATGEGGGPARRAAMLGFEGYRPIGNDGIGFNIVEATHVRGYLRKLDAEAEAMARREAIAEKTPLQRALATYQQEVATLLPELHNLTEAEARHMQRLADEKACARAEEIRRTLRARHAQAVSAANELGVEAPAAPEID